VSVRVVLQEPADRVWLALVDAARYPDWLLGAQEVEPPADWPQPGAVFHHRIGTRWVRLPGSTTSVGVHDGESIQLEAGMGVLGRADVELRVVPAGEDCCVVEMRERPAAGIVAAVAKVAGPLVRRALDARNAASLRRLDGALRSRPWVGDAGGGA